MPILHVIITIVGSINFAYFFADSAFITGLNNNWLTLFRAIVKLWCFCILHCNELITIGSQSTSISCAICTFNYFFTLFTITFIVIVIVIVVFYFFITYPCYGHC